MHLIERYALSTGLEIDNPDISLLFYPTACDNYVCFHASSKDQLRDYDYWDEVKGLIDPHFEKLNLKTLQIGLEKDPDLNCDIDLRGRTNIRQMAYIVKNSFLFLGVDSFPAHLAGFYNRKMVSIYSNSFAACVRPYWGDQSNQKIIETERPNGEKPSFSFSENPKTVNRIKPEIIANSALELLGQEPINYETIYIGSHYKSNFFEVIPIKKTTIKAENIDVRMDYAHNEDVLSEILKRNIVEVTLSAPISENIIKSKRIKKIIYKAESFDKDFCKLIKKEGIPHILVCTSSENLSKERVENFDILISYLDIKESIENNKKKINIDDFNEIKIKSNKKIVCGDKLYESYFDLNERKNLDHFYIDLEFLNVYIDSDERE